MLGCALTDSGIFTDFLLPLSTLVLSNMALQKSQKEDATIRLHNS
uniref:Uncharacterized protein n=1 Tax=Nelumbo nucifera TaxID=4432 RepID=A0A822ZMI1_NELNU|nr:TPA_asm: hypothetical protein HUJ06_017171 [Nelumbo nucifera]